jgi:hypothetical protein
MATSREVARRGRGIDGINVVGEDGGGTMGMEEPGGNDNNDNGGKVPLTGKTPALQCLDCHTTS